LEKGDEVVALAIVVPDAKLLVAGENGIGKRTDFEEYRAQSRGGKGIITMKTTEKTGAVVGALTVRDADEIMLITVKGQMVRICVKDIREAGRNTQGVKLIELESGDKLQAIASGHRRGQGRFRRRRRAGEIIFKRVWMARMVKMIPSKTMKRCTASANTIICSANAFYGFFNLEGLHDGIADLQYRFTLSPGAGYYFLKETNTTLAGELGPGLIFQRLGGVDTTYASLRLAERFEHKLNNGARLGKGRDSCPR
jgi:hypothetical protein